MSQLEPYLPEPIVDRIWSKYVEPIALLAKYDTQIASGRVAPPWHGKLPDGTVGWTNHPVLQFIVTSEHPRALQRKHGVRHTTVATVWQRAFEDAQRETKYFVSGDRLPAEETIFRGVIHKHTQDLASLESIIN